MGRRRAYARRGAGDTSEGFDLNVAEDVVEIAPAEAGIGFASRVSDAFCGVPHARA